MKHRNLRHFVLGALAAGTTTLLSGVVVAADAPTNRVPTTGSYANLPADQIEELTTVDQLKGVAGGNVAPTEIWRRLEHGEKVECLDCIPVVSKLIYDKNAKTREIAAWWLRRRIFGVFGPGQVYQQTVQTVTDQGANREVAGVRGGSAG